MEPITRKELFMAKAAGQNVNVPEPITREEKYLAAIGGSGGGGGAQPDWNAAEGEPGHILNRPFYEETVTLFDQTVEFQDMEGMRVYVGTFPEPLENKTYRVTYNGVTYECTPFAMSGVLDVLGNLAFAGGVNTGEPFLMQIADQDGDGVIDLMVADFSEVTSATVKIEKLGELRKIERKFAPEIPYFDLVSLGFDTLKIGAVSAASGIGHNLFKALGDGPVKIRVKHQDYDGGERDATAIVTGTLCLSDASIEEYTFGWLYTVKTSPNGAYVLIKCSKTGSIQGTVYKHALASPAE